MGKKKFYKVTVKTEYAFTKEGLDWWIEMQRQQDTPAKRPPKVIETLVRKGMATYISPHLRARDGEKARTDYRIEELKNDN